MVRVVSKLIFVQYDYISWSGLIRLKVGNSGGGGRCYEHGNEISSCIK